MLNILVAHGGGPTAVINTSLQGVVEAARASGRVNKIWAARYGAEGILKGELIDLTDVPASVISRLGETPASAIGSCRRKLSQADYPVVLDTLRRFDIDCFFYNGGNDSMDTCLRVSELARRENMELRVMGIPKTMDNDLEVTDHCPGYPSAARYAALSASELALDASALPIHVVVLELMGRNAGWVTAAAALAGRLTDCETLTCLPEAPLDEDRLLTQTERAYAKGRGLLVTVSEGLRDLNGRPLSDTGIVDGFGHVVPGGVAQHIADAIMRKLGLKARAEKPGLLGRASMACVSDIDRREAYEVGAYALRAALSGESDSMVAIRTERKPRYRSELFLTPLASVANAEKKFPNEWITDDYGVADEFFDYALPLIGAPLPDYARLR